MGLKTYDPNQVQVIVGGFPMSGFADGTFVTVEKNEDAWALQMGTDGEGTRSKSNNESGRVIITLMQSSESNDILNGFAESDRLSNSGLVPVMVKDSLGSALHAAEQAWIVKKPASEYAREAGPREWILETDNLQDNPGGIA